MKAEKDTPADREVRKKDRAEILSTSFKDYLKQGWPEELASLLIPDHGLEILYREDAESLLNERYWEMLDGFVSPFLNHEVDSAKRIQLFKILSTTELAIAHSFVFALKKQTGEMTREEREFELILNAHFGFYCSLCVLTGWADFTSILNDQHGRFAALDDISTTVYDEHPINVLEEHVRLVAFSIHGSEVVAMTNATWWRMFCLYIKDKDKPYPEAKRVSVVKKG